MVKPPNFAKWAASCYLRRKRVFSLSQTIVAKLCHVSMWVISFRVLYDALRTHSSDRDEDNSLWCMGNLCRYVGRA